MPPSKRTAKRTSPPNISVVIPLINEEGSLVELHERLVKALTGMRSTYEILFIDDGSTDASFETLKQIRARDSNVHIIRFRRNFGKSAGLSVGFHEARGTYVVTMDADLQDDPAE